MLIKRNIPVLLGRCLMNNVKQRKRVISTNDFQPNKDDVILLDTNVLIRLFSPYNIGAPNNYDKLWCKISGGNAKLIITSVQISEFINRCIRIEFNLYKKNENLPELDYKSDYRSTDDYKEKMKDILDIISDDIQPNFSFVDDCFSKMKAENIFVQGFSYDFNDALIVEIAKQYNAILVTDDRDYANYKIKSQIVTSNKLLLNMRF